MASSLATVPFTADLFPLVADFDCRADRSRPPTPWEEDVNEWIKPETEPRPRYWMNKKGSQCRIWLYIKEREGVEGYDVVGYGSLCRSKWPDVRAEPWRPDLPKEPVSLIPSVGIQTPFQGQPSDVAPSERYSSQIIEHLIFEARKTMTERLPFVALYVHPENEKAIRLYRRCGFAEFAQTYTHPNGMVYRSMILALRPFLRHKSDE